LWCEPVDGIGSEQAEKHDLRFVAVRIGSDRRAAVICRSIDLDSRASRNRAFDEGTDFSAAIHDNPALSQDIPVTLKDFRHPRAASSCGAQSRVRNSKVAGWVACEGARGARTV
jgi:hypothetical protein